MANTYLERIIEAGSVGRTFTYSVWFKRTKTGASTQLWNLSSDDDSTKYIEIAIKSDDKLDMQFRNGTSGDNGTYIRRIPTRVFRDTNAFFHIVLRFDSTESSADDRFRLYINGEQETSFSTSTGTIPQNYVTDVANSGGEHRIGRGSGGNGGGAYFEGSMSHFHFVDGQSYAPTVFGSTDSTTGEWKINPSPSISTANYGTNGFFILKDGNSVTDQSGRSNNFTVGGGTLTKTEDNPSNVFATMNPLGNYVAPTTLSQGNNTVAMTNSKGGNLSTLACTGGKYYSEMKIATMPQDSRFHIGILPKPISVADDPINTGNNGIMLSGFNAVIYANSGSGSASLNNFYGNATGRFSGTPILGCAVDLSSATKTMAISINGAWVTGSNTTDASFSNALKVDISTPVALEDDWFFGCGSGNGSGTTGVYNWNFGNGYFGTTAVSSAGTNASEIGIFEYDVPTGYTALSTKGLNL